jgi:hypothetical protein
MFRKHERSGLKHQDAAAASLIDKQHVLSEHRAESATADHYDVERPGVWRWRPESYVGVDRLPGAVQRLIQGVRKPSAKTVPCKRRKFCRQRHLDHLFDC